MDLFKHNWTTEQTLLEDGQMINGYTSIMWIERYFEPGEFEMVAPLSSGLMDFLPIGTLISHINTGEVMIVENHVINEGDKEDPILTLSGRTFDSFLENRIVGVNQARASSTISEYALATNYTQQQAVKLINDHITSPPANAGDILFNIQAITFLPSGGTNVARSIKPGPLDERVREILAVDDLGIRTRRRAEFRQEYTYLEVYRGLDRTEHVIFSWKGGDLDQAEYLFTEKKLKTSALVQGRYVRRVVDGPETKYERRFMIVDADDLDGNLSAAPTGAALTAVLNKMLIRGQEALKAQSRVVLSQGDISNTTQYRYRENYELGDLVRLDGNFGEIAIMRVTEFTEIDDETGSSGHPTLQVPGEE